MHNIPNDAAADPAAPWNEPDYIVPETHFICWACDQAEEDCECDDGFDPREMESDL